MLAPKDFEQTAEGRHTPRPLGVQRRCLPRWLALDTSANTRQPRGATHACGPAACTLFVTVADCLCGSVSTGVSSGGGGGGGGGGGVVVVVVVWCT